MNNQMSVFEYNLKSDVYKSDEFYFKLVENSDFILRFSNKFLRKNVVEVLLSARKITNIQEFMDYKICCFIQDDISMINEYEFVIAENNNVYLEDISEMDIFRKRFIRDFIVKIKWSGNLVIFGHDLDPFYIIQIK